MLSILHKEIEKIIPIDGISQNYDGSLNVFYKEKTPTEDELKKINLIISNWPLEEKKLKRLDEIDSKWISIIEKGWDSGQGHLGLKAEDVALLAGNFALAKESAALGGPIPPLVTEENNIITFNTIHDLTMLMLAYGQARSMLSVEFAEKRKAVQNATTIQELEAIP